MMNLGKTILVEMYEWFGRHPGDSLLNYSELFGLVWPDADRMRWWRYRQANNDLRRALRMLVSSRHLWKNRVHGITYFGLSPKGKRRARRWSAASNKTGDPGSGAKKPSGGGNSGCVLLILVLAIILFLVARELGYGK